MKELKKHHQTAADHYEKAAAHHRTAAEHADSGEAEAVGTQAHLAHAHAVHGHEAAGSATKRHLELHGKSGKK